MLTKNSSFLFSFYFYAFNITKFALFPLRKESVKHSEVKVHEQQAGITLLEETSVDPLQVAT